MKIISDYNHYNIKASNILADFYENGKSVDWQGKKISTMELACSYERLGNKKHYRVKDCGSFLEFKRFEDQSLKLNKANFCKVRLCPLCSWRRSLKIFGQVSKVMNYLESEEYAFLFLTLTTRNCLGFDLSTTIDLIFKAFKKLTRSKEFKKSVEGFFRALEVTHNVNPYSDWFDTYHPHLHVILVVRKSYFKKKDLYINQWKWTELWRKFLDVEYKPIVDIRRFKKGRGKGIAEVAKYTVKSCDYIVKDDVTMEILEDLTDDSVFVLDKALAHRRLTSFGGILKDIHKKLNLDDPVDGDLIHTDNDDIIRDDLNYIIERYKWNVGYKQYFRI